MIIIELGQYVRYEDDKPYGRGAMRPIEMLRPIEIKEDGLD